MSRRNARRHAFELIFQLPFHKPCDYPELKDLYTEGLPETEREFIDAEFSGVVENLARIDELISGSLSGWKIERINRADLAALRLAIYEMTCSGQIPVSVSINEAVELAKAYGTDDSYGFVNAVLGRIANE